MQQSKRNIAAVLTACLACCMIAACSEAPGSHKHSIWGKDNIPLPPVAMQIPTYDSACDLLHPTRDSTSIAWLRFLPNRYNYETKDVYMCHIYSSGRRFLLTMYYPQSNGLYSPDSSFTAVMKCSSVSPDTIRMTGNSGPYYYALAAHKWYYRTPREYIPQVPSLKVVNRFTMDYIARAGRNDSNTLVRFGDVTMHRIYHYGYNWYLADYSTLSADVSLMKRSNHPLGTRFDYADIAEQRHIYNLTIRPFKKKGLTADEDFRRQVSYFVVGKKDSIYCFSLGTDSLRYALKRKKTWQYKYSYYDSVFYAGPRWVDSAYKP